MTSTTSSELLQAAQQLQQLRSGLAQLAQSQTSASALGQQARSATALLQALPARYGGSMPFCVEPPGFILLRLG